MIVENIVVHEDLKFEEYLKLSATSFSSLKGGKVQETYGMHIGSLVHKYILKPKEYNYEEYNVVAPVARELINYVGHQLLKMADCEKPMTADFVHDGFRLKWKGVPDVRIGEIIVIDFKVLAGSLSNYLERFQYPEQCRGYMLPCNAQQGLIIAYNRAKSKVEIAPVIQDTRFWRNIILSRGEVI